MASIQQSYNQLFGALAGISTAGAYMYRQSPTFKAHQLEREAEALQDFTVGSDVADKGEAYELSRQKLIEAGTIAPEGKVRSHDDPSKKATRAERAKQLIDEQKEEARHEESKALKAELDKAHETIQKTILGQDLLSSKEQQTQNFQDALKLLREKEGPYGTIR